MASGPGPAKGPLPIAKLPFSVAKQLEAILDSTGDWEQLAGLINLTQEEVLHLRMQASKNKSSPTSGILLTYGARGRNTNHLFMLFMRMKNVRALKLLMPYVDEKHRAVVSNLEPGGLRDSKSPTSSLSNTNSIANGGSSIVERLSKMKVDESSSSLSRPAPALVHPTSRQSQYTTKDKNAAAGACATASAQSSSSRAPCKAAADSALEASLKATLNISYNELAKATRGFDDQNILGRGGYGVVYFGVWLHTDIAVKRLIPPEGYPLKERVRQSLSELQALSTYRHDNILPLYGYSLDGPEPCLVYQFMAGGSLEDRILCRNGRASLLWPQRLEIIMGAARGINFLHTCTQEPLIHGDVKSANILLNEHLVAKIGDFGLSRKGVAETESAPPLIASHIKGTLAYLPPEFIRSKHLSRKLDVYSFSVVLLEVATGTRAHSDNRRPENLVDFVKHSLSSSLADETLLAQAKRALADRRQACGSEAEWRIFEAFVDAGLRCCNIDPDLRPTMDEVLSTLNCVISLK